MRARARSRVGVAEAAQAGQRRPADATALVVRDEVRAAGFQEMRVFGVEDPAWSQLKAVEQHTGRPVFGTSLFDSALAAARMAEPYPELLAASSHLLAVGRRPGPK